MLFMVTTLIQAQKLSDLNLDSTVFRFEYEEYGNTIDDVICNVHKNGITNIYGSMSKYNVLFTMSPKYWFNDLWYMNNEGHSLYYYRDIKIFTINKQNKKTYYDKFEFYSFYEKLDSVIRGKISINGADSCVISKRSTRMNHLPSYFSQKKHKQYEHYDDYSILEYPFRKGWFLFYEPKINHYLYGWHD